MALRNVCQNQTKIQWKKLRPKNQQIYPFCAYIFVANISMRCYNLLGENMTKSNMDMTCEKGMIKNLIVFVTPLMLSGILQLLFTASDLIVCGMFGSEHSVGAISSTNALINLIVNLFLGLSIGANILMARCYGRQDSEKGQRVAYTAVVLSAIMGIGVGVLGATCSKYFLQWMGTNPELIDLSTRYLQIYFVGIPFSLVYNFCAALLRAVGDTRRPFYFLTASGLINVALNLLFVIVFKLDVVGVAIATSISQALSAAAVIVYMRLKKNNFFLFRFSKIRFYRSEALEIARLGLPAGLQSMIFSISNVMIQTSVNDLSLTLGPESVDGNGAAASLEGFVYTAMNSCAQAVVTFGSANYAAHKKANIKKVIVKTILLISCAWLITGSVVLIFAGPLLGLYVRNNPAAVQFGLQRIYITVGTYVLCGLMDTFAFALRAIGYSVLPTIISTCGACGFRLLWIFFIFPLQYFHNITWLAISYPISWLLTALVHLVCFAVLYKKLKMPAEQPVVGTTATATT